MLTINTILNEIKGVPQDKLDELHEFIQSLTISELKTENRRKKILSYGGAFKNMSEDDYAGFVKETRKTRKSLFTRHIDL